MLKYNIGDTLRFKEFVSKEDDDTGCFTYIAGTELSKFINPVINMDEVRLGNFSVKDYGMVPVKKLDLPKDKPTITDSLLFQYTILYDLNVMNEEMVAEMFGKKKCPSRKPMSKKDIENFIQNTILYKSLAKTNNFIRYGYDVEDNSIELEFYVLKQTMTQKVKLVYDKSETEKIEQVFYFDKTGFNYKTESTIIHINKPNIPDKTKSCATIEDVRALAKMPFNVNTDKKAEKKEMLPKITEFEFVT